MLPISSHLLWNRGQEADFREARYGCGAPNALLHLVVDLGKTVGGTSICRIDDVEGDVPAAEWNVSVEHTCRQDCPNKAAFLKDNKATMAKLRNKYHNLDKKTRLSLLQWQLGQFECGKVFCDGNYSALMTPFSEAVCQSHREYSDLMYPKKTKLCWLHGVMAP